MKKFSVIFLFFGLLTGEQKNTGLMLKKDASTVIIPHGQTIEISFDDSKTLKEGVLFNVSLNTIYLKSLSFDETIAIPKNKIYSINASARTIKMKDFRQGGRKGSMMGIELGTIITFQQYLEHRELMTIFIGSAFLDHFGVHVGSQNGFKINPKCIQN